jgi:ribonuclease BN (tRNA processing enzyme)
VAVVIDERPYLVDFGPGVVRRAAAACLSGVEGLAVRNLDRAFVTHLHSDHTAGYPDLILTPWVLGRSCPLQVFGPAGTRALTDHILAAYREDIRERIDGAEPANLEGCRVVVREVEPGLVYEDERVKVDAFSANHGTWPAYSYRFTSADRTVVVSGDTAAHEAMVAEYLGCDVLVHEVYASAGLENRPPEWQRYHTGVHTSARELGRIAAQAQPRLLVLVHQLLWGESEQSLLGEIGENYWGAVVSGQDLDVF